LKNLEKMVDRRNFLVYNELMKSENTNLQEIPMDSDEFYNCESGWWEVCYTCGYVVGAGCDCTDDHAENTDES